MNYLSDAFFDTHASGCSAVHMRLERSGTALCGHYLEPILIPPFNVSGLTLTCEAGVGVWLLAGGELHRCHREVSNDDIRELMDLTASGLLTTGAAG